VCSRFFTLPEMPMLTHLTVTSCLELQIIPSFPSPKLIQAAISCCRKVNDVSLVVNIDNCSSLVSIPSLPNVKKLEIENCRKLSDLQQVTREWKMDFIPEKRVVRLSDLPSVNDFSFCQSFFSLKLSNLPGLKNCRGIGNIHYLTIADCKNMISTDGLGKVTGKCVLTYYPSLQFLIDLKDIPSVEFYSCSAVSNLNGLGNHESLLFKNCLIFETFLVKNIERNKCTRKYFQQFNIYIDMPVLPKHHSKYGRRKPNQISAI
jgi:hypothetical protein